MILLDDVIGIELRRFTEMSICRPEADECVYIKWEVCFLSLALLKNSLVCEGNIYKIPAMAE